MNLNTNFSDLVDELTTEIKIKKPSKFGTLVRVVGLTLEARGLEAPLGAICEIVGDDCSNKVDAEVVGFQDQVLFLMPFTEPTGINPGATVKIKNPNALANIGPELLGRVIDANGEPLDGLEQPKCSELFPLKGISINPMERGPINKVLDVGVKAINSFLTIGQNYNNNVQKVNWPIHSDCVKKHVHPFNVLGYG